MTSISPSTWAFVPNLAAAAAAAAAAGSSSSSSLPATLLFRPKKPRFLKPLLASSSSIEDAGAGEPQDPVKLAFSKAEAYKKSKASSPAPGPDPPQEPEVPAAVRLAMEKAREYKQNKAAASAASGSGGIAPVEKPKSSGAREVNIRNKKGFVEKNLSKKESLNVSSVDFLGLDFSEKKNYRGRRPGLAPVVEPVFDEDFPEVEIIVGDASKLQDTPSPKMSSSEAEDTNDLYKPKVSTWGVFPRPSNISKMFGGGRVIRPGEQLETAEDKSAKEKRSKDLIASYKKKMGITIDAKTKLECENSLREGDSLMDRGKLREALPYYEQVMKAAVFQSELHGLAALQWSICQDSLRRPNEARVMYEKLQSHPNVQVSKKARQFVFSFQAMEMMKVTSSSFSPNTGYEDYFEAFVEKKANYSAAREVQNEDLLVEGLPYLMFILSPILFVFFIAARKSF